MASKCPKCENTTFEMVEEPIQNSSFKKNAIRCSHCKTVISFTDYYDTVTVLKQIADALKIRLHL